MKLLLHCAVLTLVSSTVLAILPIPELHFQEKIVEHDKTEITCTLNYTERMEVNLEIKGNATFRDCKQKTEDQPNNVTHISKTCTIHVTREMDKMEFLCEAHFKTQSKPKKMYLQNKGDRTETSITIILTVLMSTSLMFSLS